MEETNGGQRSYGTYDDNTQPVPTSAPPAYPVQQSHQVLVVTVNQPLMGSVGSVPLVQSYTSHIVLACFTFWCCGIVFGLLAFILAGHLLQPITPTLCKRLLLTFSFRNEKHLLVLCRNVDINVQNIRSSNGNVGTIYTVSGKKSLVYCVCNCNKFKDIFIIFGTNHPETPLYENIGKLSPLY